MDSKYWLPATKQLQTEFRLDYNSGSSAWLPVGFIRYVFTVVKPFIDHNNEERRHKHKYTVITPFDGYESLVDLLTPELPHPEGREMTQNLLYYITTQNGQVDYEVRTELNILAHFLTGRFYIVGHHLYSGRMSTVHGIEYGAIQL